MSKQPGIGDYVNSQRFLKVRKVEHIEFAVISDCRLALRVWRKWGESMMRGDKLYHFIYIFVHGN